MDNILSAFLGSIFTVIFVTTVYTVIRTFFLFWAWNFVMPVLFHLPAVDPMQAFALSIVVGLLIPVTILKPEAKK